MTTILPPACPHRRSGRRTGFFATRSPMWTQTRLGGLRLAGFAAVGAEAPAVALGIAGGKVAGAVIAVVQGRHDLGACGHGPVVQSIGVLADDVAAGRTRLHRPRVVRVLSG